MALPSTIYRVTIQLSDLDRSLFETLQTTVARHPSETEERLVARLLAYTLFYEEGISFTKGICDGYQPDLWTKAMDGRVTSWIEVGLPDPDRLIKAAKHADRAWLLACGIGLPVWERQHLNKLARSRNLTVVGIDQVFIGKLVASLERSINWSVTITEGTLYLQLTDQSLEIVPHVILQEMRLAPNAEAETT